MLDPKVVAKIRHDGLAGMSYQQLADKYDISYLSARDIIRNISYHDSQYIPPASSPQPATLSVSIVKSIRRDWNNTDLTLDQLADKYNLSQPRLRKIVYNKKYVDKGYDPQQRHDYPKYRKG